MSSLDELPTKIIMNNSISLVILLVAILLGIGCKNRKEQLRIELPKSNNGNFSTEGIDQSTFKNLIETVDHIDVQFQSNDASMNIDGKRSVYLDLQYISSKPLTKIPDKCYPVAHKIFLSQGEIIMEADLYHGKDCNFQIFTREQKELYGNFLTAQGAMYVQELLKQVETGPPTQ